MELIVCSRVPIFFISALYYIFYSAPPVSWGNSVCLVTSLPVFLKYCVRLRVSSVAAGFFLEAAWGNTDGFLPEEMDFHRASSPKTHTYLYINIWWSYKILITLLKITQVMEVCGTHVTLQQVCVWERQRPVMPPPGETELTLWAETGRDDRSAGMSCSPPTPTHTHRRNSMYSMCACVWCVCACAYIKAQLLCAGIHGSALSRSCRSMDQ